jgi:hypothetical protein
MLNDSESSLVTTEDEFLDGECIVIVPILGFWCTVGDEDVESEECDV